MTPTQLVSIASAAEQLSVSTKTIRRMIARGDLSARRVGPRLVRIEASSLHTVGQQLTRGTAA
jgi:excisionase family DNA binding protein